jgi:hypothetical protein
MASGEAASF